MATAKKAPAKTAAVKAAAPAKTAAAGKDAAPAKKRTPNAAFMKALTPSPALAAIVGAEPLPRTEVISKLWVYIKANNLQDAANKRMINADAKLKEVFGKPQVSMFEMAGLIGKHVK
ncbi:MAG: SWIB/MDM2 domain-containing protein [Rhodoferax sp.]|nr:SWIB/MDM2 domain-containing protein [Rhodoferax sp.]